MFTITSNKRESNFLANFIPFWLNFVYSRVKCIVIRSKESKVNSPSTTASSPIFNSTNNSTAVPNTNPKSIKKQANTLGVEESVIIKNSTESTENSALAENSNHHPTKIHVNHEQLVLTKLIHIENNVSLI